MKQSSQFSIAIAQSIKSITHISDVPCARNSLLGGIASGAGIGIIRGISSSTSFLLKELLDKSTNQMVFGGAIMAGNWAMATFVIVSLGSLYVVVSHVLIIDSPIYV